MPKAASHSSADQKESPPEPELTDGAIPGETRAGSDEADPPASPEEAGPNEAGIDPLVLEALLMGTHHPLTGARLVELTAAEGVRAVRQGVTVLNDIYEKTGRAFRIEQVAGGYQMLTLPQFGEHLKRLHQHEADAKLTKAALETLAIIAYKQPILRADLEAIRGVASGETIRSLMEKHLVKIAGRAELPGRPILYGTTKRFLELFGLNTLKDLPMSESGVAPLRPGPARGANSGQPSTAE